MSPKGTFLLPLKLAVPDVLVSSNSSSKESPNSSLEVILISGPSSKKVGVLSVGVSVGVIIS